MSKRFKAVITDLIVDSLEPELAVLGDLAEIESLDAHDERELAGRIEDADAVMLYHSLDLSRRTIETLTCCRAIVRCGVGYDNVDCEAALKCGIPVMNVPDYGTEEVADSAIGMMLALTRGIAPVNTRLRGGDRPWHYAEAAPLYRLRDRVFAIVGLGRIGTAAAVRAKAFGMDVWFYDPYKSDGYEKAMGVHRADSLDELLARAHVLSLHCPLTAETEHMISASAMDAMQAGSYLVNTARGGLVETAAIPDAIASGRLAGAGIDLLETDPPSDQDPLLRAWRDPKHPAYERVLLNPHSAFYCEEGLIEMRRKGAEACRRALLGMPLRNVVNHFGLSPRGLISAS
jgi:D-3-phosphoglycerate dehydrogenase/C-terminal binding protein